MSAPISTQHGRPSAVPVAVAVDRYRSLMGAFPTGVAVVTAIGPTGRPYGLTCTSLTSVTLAPPTLLACLAEVSGTLAAIRHSGGFAINLLHARARHTAGVFSSPGPDRFARVTWRCSPGTGQPWLVEDAFAVAECVVVQSSMVGDHAVVFGRVVHVQQTAGVPLLYGARQYAAWPVQHGARR